MPTSRPDHVPTVLAAVRKLKPASVLDVGVGFGKWGLLFREYLDVVHAEDDPARYPKTGWRTRIDGVEGFEPYLADHHRYLYDGITVGDAATVVPAAGGYDLIFLGDVIEHFPRDDGNAVIAAGVSQAEKAFIFSTPATFREQGAAVGNTFEIHRSHWAPADFTAHGDPADWAWEVVRGDVLVAVHFGPDAPENVRRSVRNILAEGVPAAAADDSAVTLKIAEATKKAVRKERRRNRRPAPTLPGRVRRAWGELTGNPVRRGGTRKAA